MSVEDETWDRPTCSYCHEIIRYGCHEDHAYGKCVEERRINDRVLKNIGWLKGGCQGPKRPTKSQVDKISKDVLYFLMQKYNIRESNGHPRKMRKNRQTGNKLLCKAIEELLWQDALETF